MYRRDAYQRYFVEVLGGKPETFPTYRSYLNRVDEMCGGIEERIAADGRDGLRDWAKRQTEGPFEKYGSNARSILNSYIGFAQESGGAEPAESSVVSVEADTPGGALFKVEKEMQRAIRQDIEALEPGLTVVDGGVEVTTATGRIDILARDAAGMLVIIELKATICPVGALEQVLGYAQSLEEERNERTRAILVASSFTDRQRAAVQRMAGLELRTYRYHLSYDAV